MVSECWVSINDSRLTDRSARRCPAWKKPQQPCAKTQLISGSFARQFLRVIFAHSPRQIIRATFRDARLECSCIVLRRSGTDCGSTGSANSVTIWWELKSRYLHEFVTSRVHAQASSPIHVQGRFDVLGARSIKIKSRSSQENLSYLVLLHFE